MGEEKNGLRRLGGKAMGCLTSVGLMVLVGCLMKEDTMVSAVAYLIIFTILG